jgi:hypothetical protein
MEEYDNSNSRTIIKKKSLLVKIHQHQVPAVVSFLKTLMPLFSSLVVVLLFWKYWTWLWSATKESSSSELGSTTKGG